MKQPLYHQAENSSFSILSVYLYSNGQPCKDGMHFHKNYEFINAIEGSCEVNYKNTSFSLKKGDAILIEPFIPHEIILAKNSQVRSVVFHKLLIYSLSNIIEGYHPETPIFRPNVPIVQYYNTELTRCFGTETSKKERLSSEEMLTVKGCLYAMGSELIRQIKLIPAEKINDTLIQETIEYVSRNYKSNISLKEIARTLGYSYHYLSRLFNNTLGINFKSLLNLYRAEYAAALLEDTRMPIGEIAFKSGFQNIRSFNEYCKAIYGKTPKEIRKTSQLVI